MAPGAFRTIQVGRDHVAGQALEHHVLDHVTGARSGLGHAGVERPTGLGQPAEQREHARTDGGVPRLCGSRVLDSRDG